MCVTLIFLNRVMMVITNDTLRFLVTQTDKHLPTLFSLGPDPPLLLPKESSDEGSRKFGLTYTYRTGTV